jgi:4-aminobutyrate aminotransferase/4-aminobutyrate aminotransferase/(S)-3-amino-2-methylpropionate transaminase
LINPRSDDTLIRNTVRGAAVLMSKTQELQARHKAAVPQGVASKAVYASRADNAQLWDVDGVRLIDFAAGIAVVNTGHRHPAILEAVSRQLEAFTHTCFHVAPYESYIALAERLNHLAPGDFPKKSFFVTTGAEAVENAIKVARYYTKRSGVVAFSGAFHGRTHMAMALTGKVAPYKKGFGPMPAEVHHAPFPMPYRSMTTDMAVDGLLRLLRTDLDPSSVAAFIVEPVQGEGGFNVAPPEFLRALRTIADQHGILLIADEVQGGIARTGRMFSIEHSEVVPDVITLAKGLGGGFPLAAVTGRATVMDAVHPGGIGGTYAGSPVGIAAAHAVLDVIESEKLCDRALRIGENIKERLTTLSSQFARVAEVRGLGAMVAMEIVKDPKSREPDPNVVTEIVRVAQERGLLLLSCGEFANVIRLLPPLTIPDALLEEGLNILCESAARVLGNSSNAASLRTA